MRIVNTILFLLLTLISVKGVSQVFPVQATTQLRPPYSLFLSDYAAPGSERLALNVFLVDAGRPELNVRFRLRIEGQGIRIETKPEFLPPPTSLTGGVPLQLISADLAPYFESRNLNFTGISQREYEQRGALPEGLYQFCFEVLEYNRGVKISNTSCAAAWLILNDPPIVNLPRDGEKVRIQEPQQVIFQWTPRHTGSPNSAFSTEYDFKMVEIWPPTRNPNDAILTSPPVFETTTNATTLIYGPAETPLEPGRRYAIQLKARSVTGVEELNLFKNNGLSQVYTFQYGDACNAPTNIVGEAPGPSRIALSWNGGLNETAYKVRYRPASSDNSVWYTDNIFLTDHEIKSLQPNTRYEYQIAATCGTFESTWSTVASITTPDVEGIAYSCGLPMAPFNLDPSQLIDVINVGDVIRAGDFDVKISKVTGSAGTFSGEGVIEVSYFNKAKVKAEFTNIVVNKELRMVNGFMNVTGAGVEIIPAGVMDFMDKLDEALAQVDSLLNEYEANLPQQFDPGSFVADTAIRVNGTIASVTKDESGNVVIVDASGTRTTVPAGTSAAITDSSGNGYLVDKKGNIHKTSADVAAKAGNREYNLALKFDASPNQAFGFDVKHNPLAVKYERLEGDKYASWKSVATGRTDAVLAILEGTGFDKSKIRFEQAGVGIPNASMPNATTTPMPNAFDLNVRGGADGIEEGLLALYTPPDTTQKEQVLGKLNVATYDEIQKTVVIVPVNGNKYPYSEANLRTQLNKIYGQAVVKWNVQMAPEGFIVPGIDPFDDGGSGLLSNYSPDMRKVVDAYNTDPAPDTYYLFLVKNPKAGKLAGYMPRSKEFGFIFTDQAGSEQAIIHTMAHELGHGAFNLRHTFAEEKYTIPQGSTDNLMDYTPAFGTKLYKHQWDQMRYPEIVMGLFESDEDAMHTGVKVIPEMFWNSNNTVTFISPAGGLVVLPNTVKGLVFAHGFSNLDYSYRTTGTLLSFVLDGITYSSGPISFAGYDSKLGKYELKVSDTDKQSVTASFLMAFPCETGIGLYQFSSSGQLLETSEARDILEEINFPIRPFSANKLLKSKIYSVDNFVELTEGNDTRFEVTDYEMDMLSGYCDKPEILPISKKAQLRNVYPTLYADFDARIAGIVIPELATIDDEFKEIYKTVWDAQTKSDKYDYICVYNDSFREYVKKRQEISVSLLNQLTLSSPVAQLNFVFSSFGISDYENLTLSQRLLCLRIATNGLIASGPLERAVRNLVMYTPSEDQKAMLDSLAVINNGRGTTSLLHALSKDWIGLDGNEFTETISTIVDWVFAYYPMPEALLGSALSNEVSSENKIIPFNPGLWIGDVLSEHFKSDGQVQLSARHQFTATIITVIANPYEYIVIHVGENFTVWNKQLLGGAKIKVPALFAYLLFNNENTARLIKAGKIALDVTLFAVGVGEIRVALEAGKSWRYYRALIDLGVSVSDFAINNVLEDKLKQSPTGQQFLGLWNQITLFYGVVSISDAVLRSSVNDLKRVAEDLTTNKKLYDQDGKLLKELSDSDVSDINKTVEDLEIKMGIKGLGNVSGSVSILVKLNNVASSLDNSLVSSLLNNLDNQGFIRFDNNQYLFQTPKTFFNEKKNTLYDLIVDGKYYVKYDLIDGRILMANSQDGKYYAFAQNKSPLVIQSGLNADEVIKVHLITQIDKLKTLAGLTNNRSVNVLGQIVIPSNSKITTFIGRMDDINGLKSQLGDFKNVDLGENVGGINILNRPDVIWSSAGYEGWIVNHNMPWVKRVVGRSDDVYLVTATDDIDGLLRVTHNGVKVPTITAYEIRELIIGNIKPVNVSNQKWDEIKNYIKQMDDNNQFIAY